MPLAPGASGAVTGQRRPPVSEIALEQARLARDRDGAEVAEVEGRDGARPEPLGDGDDGGIDQAEAQGPVLGARPSARPIAFRRR